MQDIFEVNLERNVLNRVVEGKCSYIVMLNNKLRQKYKIGNKLTFICDEDADKSLKVTIKNLLYFSNVKDLMGMLGKEKCGYTAKTSIDKIEDSLYVNNKCDDIDKFGLVAIEVCVD